MSSNHLKRLAMPRSWPLPRKTSVWVTRPTPGAHSLELCMPITLVVRDVLNLAKTAREVALFFTTNSQKSTVESSRTPVAVLV